MNSSIVLCCHGGPNWVEIATFGMVLIGGVFALWQWLRTCCVSRAEHLNAILKRYGSKKMTDLFYRLVNNTTYGGDDSEIFYLGQLRFQTIKGEKTDEGKLGDDIREDDIDAMLYLFSQICYEHERGTISKAEFDFFCFQIRRTLAHGQFKQYLLDFAKHCGRHKIGYPYLALAREGVNVDASHYAQVIDEAERGRAKFMNKLKELLP